MSHILYIVLYNKIQGQREFEMSVNNNDKLIYENSNKYRLHADNLRWTLLGGYAAFFAALLSMFKSSPTTSIINNTAITSLIFIISFLYLWILAIQNWFYNLFARWVDDCEYRLVKEIKLRPLQDFASSKGSTVNPYHPAFFLAEIIVGILSFCFLALTIKNINIPVISKFLQTIPKWIITALWIVLFCSYFGFLNFVFKKWDKYVYKRIIVKLSNLYKPVSKSTISDQKDEVS